MSLASTSACSTCRHGQAQPLGLPFVPSGSSWAPPIAKAGGSVGACGRSTSLTAALASVSVLGDRRLLPDAREDSVRVQDLWADLGMSAVTAFHTELA